MIGFLSGLVKNFGGGELLLLVHDVGYRLRVPHRVTYQKDQKVEVYVHTHVREDELSLYAFSSATNLKMFELLLTVSGIGPKSALAVLSAADSSQIQKVIEDSNLNFFTAISGIGKKSAQRILIELRPKISSGETSMAILEGNPALTDALRDLGFKNSEVLAVLPQINPTDQLSDQIRQALRSLKP